MAVLNRGQKIALIRKAFEAVNGYRFNESEIGVICKVGDGHYLTGTIEKDEKIHLSSRCDTKIADTVDEIREKLKELQFPRGFKLEGLD